MLKLLCKFPAYNDRSRSWFKLKERSARDWKVRSTKVDAGNFKRELLNRLRSTLAVNVLKDIFVFILDNTLFRVIIVKKNLVHMVISGVICACMLENGHIHVIYVRNVLVFLIV